MNRPPSEFHAGWRVLVASSLGVACGASPVPFNSLGPMTVPIAEEFGWGRAEVQLSILWFTLAVMFIVPIVGTLADRYGVRRVAIGTLVAFGLLFGAISMTPASLAAFYALWFIAGLLGGGSTPVTWTRAVNGWFNRHRGLALAITLVGTGIAAMVLPSFTTWLIERFGWRLAFVGLAMLPLAIALPFAIAWFREPDAAHIARLAAQAGTSASAPTQGVTLREALRNYRFWVLAASILLVAAGIAGTITNLQPLLMDHGFTPEAAARTVGAIGVSIIFGRLLAGFLMDRFWAPGVVLPMLLLPAIACLLLVDHDITQMSALAAAALVGFASGAETDVVAYFCARYFGLKHYGRIYGLLYTVFGFASGIAPWIFARVYDTTGSYNPILYVAAVAFGIGALLLLTLGRYPDFRNTSHLDVGPEHHHAP